MGKTMVEKARIFDHCKKNIVKLNNEHKYKIT